MGSERQKSGILTSRFALLHNAKIACICNFQCDIGGEKWTGITCDTGNNEVTYVALNLVALQHIQTKYLRSCRALQLPGENLYCNFDGFDESSFDPSHLSDLLKIELPKNNFVGKFPQVKFIYIGC